MSSEAVQEVPDEEAVDFEADAPVADDSTDAKVTDAGPAGVESASQPQPASTAETADLDQEKETEAAKNVLAEGSTEANDPMSLPPHGTEVFIGGIPRTATEAQIQEFAEQAGAVHSMRLAKDPVNPERNRGFGFVRYLTVESAEAAKSSLNDKPLTGTEQKVRISASQAKNRIYLSKIPQSWTEEQVLDELNKSVKGLEKLELIKSKENPSQNSGSAFLTFFNHECAAAGKKILSSPEFTMGEQRLIVSYAEPKPSETPAEVPNNKAIYVGKLPPGTTEAKLKELFSRYGEVSKVTIPAATERRPEQRFGFVHFNEHSAAEKAVASVSGEQKPELDGKALDVKAARPQPPLESRHGFGASLGRDAYGYGRGVPGRGERPMRGGRAGFPPRGRGRMGRGPPGRGRFGGYNPYQAGYEEGYWGYEDSYDQGYYDSYAAPVATPTAASGMTMVPMMLPSGQVGYVLQSNDASAVADYGSYGAPGPDRGHGDYGDFRSPRGRGRHSSRYRPY